MKFGICVYKDDIPAAERAGYDYVELTVTNVWPEVGENEYLVLKQYLNQFKVKPEAWRRFLPPNLPVVGPEVDFPKITEFLHITLRRIRELGGEVVVFGSPLSRNVPDDFSREKACEQILKFLGACCDTSGKNGLVIVSEPIIRRNCNIINTVAEALGIAQELETLKIRVLADLYHMWGNNEPPKAVEQAGEYLFHIHMPVPEIAGLNEPRAINTVFPDYPTRDFMQSLKNIDYDKRISIEDLDRKFMNLEREAPIVLAHIRKTWEELSR